MAYTKTTWVDDTTPLSATNMNKIETGIKNLDPALFYGKYSQMSGASSTGASGVALSFTTEDADDFGAINISTAPTRITIPAGITKVRVYGYADMKAINHETNSTVSLAAYKNGSPNQTLIHNSVPAQGLTKWCFYSLPISVEENDYLELYFSGYYYSGAYPECNSAVFGIEVLG